MAKGKFLTLCLVAILAVSSLLMVIPTNAQTIPKPFIPEFSVRYVDNSFYAPDPTAIYDQYGNFQILQGYIDNKTIEFTINNQVFTAYTIPYNSNDPTNTGQTVHLMYNIRMKSSAYNDWQYITHLSDGYLIQSNTSQTTASFRVDSLFSLGISKDEEISFQVQALIGYVHRYPVIASWTFNGTKSDWSTIQTIIIPATNNPSPSPTVPEFPITLSLVAVLAAVSLLLVLGKKKLTINQI
jgi:hypothetical protein